MSEHFPRNTVSASFWCGKCAKHTQHRIDDGRKGPCLSCCARLEEQAQRKPAAKALPQQSELFGGI